MGEIIEFKKIKQKKDLEKKIDNYTDKQNKKAEIEIRRNTDQEVLMRIRGTMDRINNLMDCLKKTAQMDPDGYHVVKKDE